MRTPVFSNPNISVTKTLSHNADGDGSGSVTQGDVLTYTVTATNTGNVPLTNVQVSDPLTSPNAKTCPNLAVGASCVLTGTYTVTATDATNGAINNTGKATSNQFCGEGCFYFSVSLRTAVAPTPLNNPAMTVVKVLAHNADGDGSGTVTVGDVLTYTVTATNTGNVTLNNVHISDPLTTPSATSCATVAVDATCVLTGTYTVTKGDATNGSINNTGSAAASQLTGLVSSSISTPVAGVTHHPAMIVSKTLSHNADGDGSGSVTQGDVLTYTVSAQNTGDVALTNVQVNDPLTTPNMKTCPTVAQASSCVLTGTYTVTATDVTNGTISNTGRATSNEFCSEGCTYFSATLHTPVLTVTHHPAMIVSKTLSHNADGDGSGSVTQGDVLTYKVSAQNTGDIALTNVQVNDPLTTPNTKTCPTVAQGSSCVLTGTYTVTASDASEGSISNTGSATASQLTGAVTHSLVTPVVTHHPAMIVSKTLSHNADGDGSGSVTQGDVLTYTVSAQNIGNIALTNVQVNDPLTTPNTKTCPTVAQGSSCVLTGTYTVTAADVTHGSISNTGSATASQLTGAVTHSLVTPVASVAYQISILSGNGQNGVPGQSLPQDFVVVVSLLIDSASASQALHAQASTLTTAGVGGVPVQWQILAGGGGLLHGGNTITDTGGHSSNHYTLGGGTGLNQVRVSVPGGASVTFNANAVASNAILKIVSGDGQSLTTNTASAPLVVQLLSNNVPVPNAVIAWTANNATLASPTSVTDASGHATNHATVHTPGTATVTASSSAPAASPVTFGLNGSISHLTGLTPQETEIANALDHACAALAASNSLNPAEQDLLRQCEAIAFTAGVDPDEAKNALKELFSNIAFLQTSAALLISTEQFDNIKARIAALRSGTGGTHFGGLAYSTPDGTVPIGAISDALLGFSDAKANDKQKDEVGSGFDRWGFFAAGTFGKGSADPRQVTPGYGFHTNGLTAGVDYRYNDHMIFGVSAGYAKYNAGVDAGRGGMDTSGWSLSAYSTLFKQDSWYLDSVLTWGSNTYDITRRIIYTLSSNTGTFTVDQTATANSSGSTLAGALTVGRDFSKGPWSFGPYFRGTYTRISFDNYHEVLQNGNGTGIGLDVQARDLKSVATVLGAKVNFASSQSWGILMPHAEVEWQHEFQDSPDSITARFLHDPTATTIQVTGDSIDTNFFRLGLGLSFVLPKGRSGFIYYEKTLGRTGITQDNLAIGLRLEF